MLVNTNEPFELKDVIPSAIHALNPDLMPTGSIDSFAYIPPSSHVIVLLIDGLGEIQLQEFGAELFCDKVNSCYPNANPVPQYDPGGFGIIWDG